MDPLSALSISAAVIQFVEFGHGLITSTLKIYKSGEFGLVELSTVSKDLSALAADVGSKFAGNGGLAGDMFRRFHQDCKTTHHDLENILRKLGARGTTKLALATSSFLAALKQVTAANDIQALADRLNGIRQHMMVALLSLLMYVWVGCLSDFSGFAVGQNPRRWVSSFASSPRNRPR